VSAGLGVDHLQKAGVDGLREKAEIRDGVRKNCGIARVATKIAQMIEKK
jgi:hypothetical protein